MSEENKKPGRKLTQARREANARYNSNSFLSVLLILPRATECHIECQFSIRYMNLQQLIYESDFVETLDL